MRALRQTLLQHRSLALWLIALALAMKALVPGGFMLREESQAITIAICGDASGAHLTRQIVVPQRETPQERAAQHTKSAACPFSALDMAGTPGADPVLLGLALAFILAVGLAPRAVLRLPTRAYLRPPLRGPPLEA
ncbi:hypothetical protein HNO88_000965 [Novosphingobium chloroacetimidivorans]|uniref:DUF2946 domain-containing protein n=1 Tax=Novosphingobium chloroacetimidivorans TaxID=1428314 RepID=A0A7W7K7H4_9SPHN|nr:DUF2946 family protein [Novosphingobium chloroacetimidivorans]MBB4857654.1 hypothetical protein [Novosphingobium chloroacetimidivorans]